MKHWTLILAAFATITLGFGATASADYLPEGAQAEASSGSVERVQNFLEGKNFMATAWWISVFPGIAIVVVGLGFSLFGDGMAELLRTRK